MTQRLRIIVCDYLVRGPVGGMAWSTVHYLKGLIDLGHEVYYLEDSGEYPACYDPSLHITGVDPTYGLAYADQVLSFVGLSDAWAYYDAHTEQWHGPQAEWVESLCASADIAFNLGGSNLLRPWLRNVPVRVLIDKDPTFTQIRHLTDAKALAHSRLHTHFYTFGINFGQPNCLIPDDGLTWQGTLHPIVLEAWPVASPQPRGRFTTVMLWRSYETAVFDNLRFGMKADSFEQLLQLPQKTSEVLELAVGGTDVPETRLAEHGWHLADPLLASLNLQTYQSYITESKAEFSVAKHGYVISNSGWFSERSASYLASGRPVAAQETGCSEWLASGSGVLTFTTADEALAAIQDIAARYELHCAEARSIVESYFDASSVLTELIDSL